MNQKSKLIYIHGGSGVGKSTIGNKLYEILSRNAMCIWIDQDSFYKQTKPIIEYDFEDEVGQTKHIKEANWDTLEAINMIGLNKLITDSLKTFQFVIVTGFALRSSALNNVPNVNVLLDYGMTAEKTREKMIKARQKSKGYRGEKAEKDRKRVEKVVWPYYEETLKLIGDHVKINVFDDQGERFSVDLLAKSILELVF